MQTKFMVLLISLVAVLVVLSGCGQPEMDAVPVKNAFLGAADQDRNGSVNRNEMEKLVSALKGELADPHKIQQPIMELADANKDGFLDDREIDSVRNLFSFTLLPRLFEQNPDFAKKIDINNNHQIDQNESQVVKEMLFFKEAQFGKPRNVRGAWDKVMDLNDDKHVDQHEIEQIRNAILSNLLMLPFDLERLLNQERPGQGDVKRVPKKEPVDDMLDLNRDGFVDNQEFEQINHVFNGMEKTPHQATDSDKKIDLNQDGKITPEEIKTVGNRLKMLSNVFIEELRPVESLLQELADINNDRIINEAERRDMENALSGPGKVQSEFGKRIDFNGNGEVEPFEIEKANRAREVMVGENQKQMPDKVKARTAIDNIFDLNKDGFVDAKDRSETINFFAKGPRQLTQADALGFVLDLNKDNFLSEEELRLAHETYLRPHPANYELEIDKKSDTNKNRFIEPEEIGVAAGFTEAGVFQSFEAIIEQQLIRKQDKQIAVKSAEPTPQPTDGAQPQSATAVPTPAPAAEKTATIYQKKIDIKNKKIAVVDLKIGSDISENFSDAIIMFVENAFVNIGTAIVVDRQNITKIIDEYKFQASDLADANKAAQIGKLAGADVIVIGNLNYVGKKYYLNIKLVDVTTAQILGSSIDTADDDTAFFDMSNNAVSKLF